MDISALRSGKLLAAAGGAALLVLTFFDWYGIKGLGGVQEKVGREAAERLGIKIPEIDLGISAWDAFDVLDLLLALTALVVIGLAVSGVMRLSVKLPVQAGVLTMALGALSVLGIVYRILNQPGDNDVIEVRIGAWLGLVAAATIVFGGIRALGQEETAPATAAAPTAQPPADAGPSPGSQPPPAGA